MFQEMDTVSYQTAFNQYHHDLPKFLFLVIHKIEVQGWGYDDKRDGRGGHITINGLKRTTKERGLHLACIQMSANGRIKNVDWQLFDVFARRQNADYLDVCVL